MKVSLWASVKVWITLNLLKQPVREVPRERCDHNKTCYMCPRSRCVGALNDRHGPDLKKPRLSQSGYCIYVGGEEGMTRLRVSVETANAHRARQAAEERGRTPRHLWKPPGYDEEEAAAVIKSIDG